MTMTAEALLAEFTYDSHHLRARWQDGSESVYDALWLRDNCPEDRDAATRQRLVDIADLPEDPEIESVTRDGDSLSITWKNEAKTSRFAGEWLRANDWTKNRNVSLRPAIRAWNAHQAKSLCWMPYEEIVASEESRYRWLRALAEQGIAFLWGVPTIAEQLFEVARYVGYVRETNYGRLFDVRSVPNPDHLANTTMGLGLHTDNPYRDPAPGLQILHCLQASGEGGESTFADGFAVARHIQETDPEAFQVLTQTPVRFTLDQADTELEAERPLIQLDLRGELESVYYNNRAIAPLRLPAAEVRAFYRAYRLLSLTLRDPQFVYKIGLKDGDLVAFDNARLLHGREAFTLGNRPRHLQGCYVDKDGLQSELAVLGRRMP